MKRFLSILCLWPVFLMAQEQRKYRVPVLKGKEVNPVIRMRDEEKSRGYSCLTSIDNNTIGILYESSQADLVFQTIQLEELL